MEGMTPSTPVLEVIKARPLSLSLFYQFDSDLWLNKEATLSDFCRIQILDPAIFLRRIMALPIPAFDSQWEDLPVYFLVDFLTYQHRVIQDKNLSAIRRCLEENPPGTSTLRGPLRFLARTLAEFSNRLNSHLFEEENSLFPAILRNAYALEQHKKGLPFEQVSGTLFVTARILNGEKEFILSLDYFQKHMHIVGLSEAEVKLSGTLSQAVEDLVDNLRRHSSLEMNELFRMSARIEWELRGITVA